MSRVEVRRAEATSPKAEDSDYIVFDAEVAGVECDLFYNFEGDSLRSASYYIDQDNDVADVGAFLQLSEMLTRKYGEGNKAFEWKNPWAARSLETVGEFAKAIATGEVAEISSEWSTPDTYVRLVIAEDKSRYNAFVVVLYSDRQDFEAKRAALRETDLDLL